MENSDWLKTLTSNQIAPNQTAWRNFRCKNVPFRIMPRFGSSPDIDGGAINPLKASFE